MLVDFAVVGECPSCRSAGVRESQVSQPFLGGWQPSLVSAATSEGRIIAYYMQP